LSTVVNPRQLTDKTDKRKVPSLLRGRNTTQKYAEKWGQPNTNPQLLNFRKP
jgi:hypothetical protein